jgi:peptidoglycan hydrolase-like protein with peptidoglycan-binding domain
MINVAATGKVLGAEKFNFTKFLKIKKSYNINSQGSEVMELQKLLNGAGFDSGKIDGKFGPITKAALIKFQIANGLQGDGIVGAKTRVILNK